MDRIDIAVVGGGAAGLYTAWRLACAGKSSVVLFDSAERVGGRIESVRIPGANATVDLGAMRFFSTQQVVCGVAEELGLASHPFPEGSVAWGLLRGKYLGASDFQAPAGIP
jgi:protoporphyrinogen oxidase